MRKTVTLEPGIHEALEARREGINSLRMFEQFPLSLPATVELLVRFATLEVEDVKNFKPSTRRPGRQPKDS
jgi:hypothetical protein